ncbi:MAG: hypothetical protein R6V76_06840 [Desulfobacterales bacterium]
MKEKRPEIDRRSKKDRRKGGASTYNGPERRSLKYRRSDTDRRKKK